MHGETSATGCSILCASCFFLLPVFFLLLRSPSFCHPFFKHFFFSVDITRTIRSLRGFRCDAGGSLVNEQEDSGCPCSGGMHAGAGAGGDASENVRLFEVHDGVDDRRGWLRGTLKFEDGSLLFTDIESERPEPQILVSVPHLLFCSDPVDVASLPRFPHGGFVTFQINSIGRCTDDNILGRSDNRQLIVLVESERDKSLWVRRINDAVAITHFWTNCRVESTATRRTRRAVGDEKYWNRKGMLVSAVSLSCDGYLHVIEDLPGPRPPSSRSGASLLRKPPSVWSVRADAIRHYQLCESPPAAKVFVFV